MLCNNTPNPTGSATSGSTIVKDNEGHTYRIPNELADQFGIMLAAIDAAEYHSEDWYDANDALDAAFNSYMFSGK